MVSPFELFISSDWVGWGGGGAGLADQFVPKNELKFVGFNLKIRFDFSFPIIV